MRPLSEWPLEDRRQIIGVFTDIDDTLTTSGAITPDALQALVDLRTAGLHVIAITGRPVGWSEPFALSWPVDAIVAENGAVALVRDAQSGQLRKLYQQDAAIRATNYSRMQQIAQRVLREVPDLQLSRDSGGRETDLAFDYNEFAKLPPETVTRVVSLLQSEGMHTAVSSIHVHGCLGEFTKWTGACWTVRTLLQRELSAELDRWVFVGDSGNDQAMFQHFTHSVGVANIRRFEAELTHSPRYITNGERGEGFSEVARALLDAREKS